MSPRVERRDLPVLVHGATGFTGRLVARELIRLRVPFGISGRSARKLADLAAQLRIPVPQFVVPEGDATTLPDVLSGTRVVINCAGPFRLLAPPVVKAAAASGTHYLDVTGEQEFVRLCGDHDREASASGAAIVPSMAFEVALADMAARLAAGRLAVAVEDLTVLYRIHRMRASHGTQKSALRVLTEPGLVVEDGRLAPHHGPPATQALTFPGESRPTTGVQIPGSEVVTIPRHTPCKRVRVYMALGGPFVSWLARTFLPHGPALLASAPGRWLRRRIEARPSGEGPTDEDRRQQTFRIAVVATGAGSSVTNVIDGVDPYGITATIAARAAQAMMEPAYDRKGTLSPSMAFEPRKFLAALAPDGIRLVEA